jgi:hypothetical protein
MGRACSTTGGEEEYITDHRTFTVSTAAVLGNRQIISKGRKKLNVVTV